MRILFSCCFDNIQLHNHDRTCPTTAARSVDGSGEKLKNSGIAATFTDSYDGGEAALSKVDELRPRKSDGGEAEAYTVIVCALAKGGC